MLTVKHNLQVSDPQTSVNQPQAKRSPKRAVLALLGSSALIGLATLGTHFWNVGRFEISTDDAYIAADSTPVASKVSGYIKDVLVTDNETVKAGQVLAHVDDGDFQTVLAQAKANVFAHSQPRKQGVRLKYHAAIGAWALNFFSGQQHVTCGGLIQASNNAQ